MILLVVIVPLGVLFLVALFLREDWLYSYLAAGMTALAIVIDYSGRDDSGCGICALFSFAYLASLAVATITGLLVRAIISAVRGCGC